MNEPKDPEAVDTVQTEKIEAVAPAAFCSALAELRNAAMTSRHDAIERGLDEKERYYRGVLDGIRAAVSVLLWRDPEKEHPTKTGKILVWIEGVGPRIVNVEERWMCFWDGHDETEPTDPSEWTAWIEISEPQSREGASPSLPRRVRLGRAAEKNPKIIIDGGNKEGRLGVSRG